jgi:hypothetical protein
VIRWKKIIVQSYLLNSIIILIIIICIHFSHI